VELVVPTTPSATVIRAVQNPWPIDFQFDSSGGPITWNPFPVQVGSVDENNRGNLTQVSVTVTNITRDVQAAIELYDGLIGMDARVMLAHVARIPTGIPTFEAKGSILASSATAESAVFEVGVFNLFQAHFPLKRMMRDFCHWKYDSPGCGYDTTRGGALPTCSKKMEGANGCREHGDDEVSAGLTRKHPQRIGLFKGLSRTQP
jgi:lambda family phage minor tail protein L